MYEFVNCSNISDLENAKFRIVMQYHSHVNVQLNRDFNLWLLVTLYII